jgi:hypothetical protein
MKKDIEVAARDEIHLYFQITMFKKMLVYKCTTNDILKPKMMHDHIC